MSLNFNDLTNIIIQNPFIFLVIYRYQPQPETSAFREASFGHGEFIVASESFASWSWHKNDDDESVQADTLAIQSLASDPLCNANLMF
ncbi:putative Acid phosphatase [Helianthus debilis subsp. tardiflorus]